MTKLCARGKAAAKRKFAVYPSAYANAYASKICAGKIKDPSGKKRKDWGPKKMQGGGSASSSGMRRLAMAEKFKTKKARTGAIINLLKQAGEKILRGKGPKKGTVYQESKGTAQSGPVDKQLKSSSLSGDEMKVVDKKARFRLEQEAAKPIQSIPVNTSKRKYKQGGLNKWFKEKWVDISSKKPGGGYRECGRKSASQSKRGYPKCVPAAKAASMTKGQIRSAVARKRSVSNIGPKPTNVKTIVKAYTGKAVKQPTETKKEFEMRHEYHTTYKHSKDYYKGLV